MEDHFLISGRDTLLIAIPFVLILMITMFRLDQLIAAPKAPLTGRQLACGVDQLGEPVLRDPDGRLSGPSRLNKGQSKPGMRGGHETRNPSRLAALHGNEDSGAEGRGHLLVG
jgi:hypothetical protein